MTFAFGARSNDNMARLVPAMRHVMDEAIARCAVDFGVPEHCWRTVEEQRAKVAAGLSKTMRSAHLLLADGTSHAVDLVPYISGAFTWDNEQAFYLIADAVRTASIQFETPIIWGGVWDAPLEQLKLPLAAEHAVYVQHYKARFGRSPLIDLPHFQLA